MPTPRNARPPALALLAALAVAACAAPPVPRDHFYRLDIAAAPSVGAAPATLGIVAVDTFEADGQLRERSLLVSTSETETQQQDYHFWSDPPARMLQAALVDYLRASGTAAAVVTPQMRVAADLRVQARVKRLERDLAAGTVVAALEIALTDPAAQRLILVETYRVERPVADASVAAAVAALNGAIGDIFDRFIADAAAHQVMPPTG